MVKYICLFLFLISTLMSRGQSSTTFTRSITFANADSDSVNYGSQNLIWFGSNGYYRVSMNGVKYSLTPALLSSGGGPLNFWKTDGNTTITGLNIDVYNNTHEIQIRADGGIQLTGMNGANVNLAALSGEIRLNSPTVQVTSDPIDNNSLGSLIGRNSSTGHLEERSVASIIGGVSAWPLTGTGALTGNTIIDGTDTYSVKIGDTSPARLTTFGVNASGAVTLTSGAAINLNGTSTAFSDGAKVTCNPNNTNAGFNFGSNVAVPSSLANGDAVYTTTGPDAVRFRIDGQTVMLGSASTNVLLLNNSVGVSTTGMANSSEGFKHKRATTGSMSANAVTNVNIAWGSTWADTNYTVTASIEEANGELEIVGFNSVTTTDVTVIIRNTSLSNARTGTLHLIAVHD